MSRIPPDPATPASAPLVAPPAARSQGAATGVRRLAYIQLDSLRQNLRGLGADDLVADVRADAYGHGLALVAPVLQQEGVRRFLVSPGQAATLHELLADGASVEVDPDALHDARVEGPRLLGLRERSARPVLRLTAEVLAGKHLRAGEAVSYGQSYRAPRDTRLALIGAGYAHGVVRRASNRAPVLVAGVTATIVGAISMDQCSADVGDAALEPGAVAVLFGDPARGEPHVLDWAERTGIDAAAITARIAATVRRIAADARVPGAQAPTAPPAGSEHDERGAA